MNKKTKKYIFTGLFLSLVLIGFVYLAVSSTSSSVHFTAAEQEWVKNHNHKIRVSGDPNYYPIDFYDSSGHRGYAHDLLKKLEPKLGVKFESIQSDSWADVLKKAKSDEIDLVSCVALTPERLKYLAFSDIYLTLPNYIVTHSSNDSILNEQDLIGKRLAIPDSYGNYFYYQKKYPGITIVAAKNDADALHKVSMKNVDAAICDLVSCNYYVNSNEASHLRIGGEADYTWKFSLGITGRDKTLTAILNKGLRSLTPTEMKDLQNDWIIYKFDNYYLHKKLLLGLAALFFIFIVLLLLNIKWRKTLEKKVALRTHELTTLKDSLKDQVNSQTLKLNETILELQKTNSENHRLFSIVSHDLKNSFHGLIAVSDVLRSEKDMQEDEREKFLKAIKLTSEKMHGLLLNLLDWTTSKSGHLKIVLQEVDTETLIKSIVDQYRLMALIKQLNITLEVEPQIVKTDRRRLETVLRNILENAVKYSNKNSTIWIQSKKIKSSLHLVIRDEGIGMDDETLDKLFKPDDQIITTGTNGEKGTGLGLLLCDQFVRDLNGRLEVSSQLGHGSEFRLVLALES